MKILLVLSAAAGLLSAGDIVLQSGPYKVHYDESAFYCSAQYFYDGTEIGGRKGFYGSILSTTGPNKFIGAGHKEGGCEKLLSMTIRADGIDQKVGNRLYTGKELQLEKVSMLGNLKMTVRHTVTPEQIVIRKQYEALDDQPIHSFYIYQFCWSNRNDLWMAGRPDGSTLDGKFNSDEGWFLCRKHHEPELLWFAQYNSDAGKGIIGFFGKYFKTQGSYMFWDRKIYHKFYFSARTPKPAKKGYRSPEYVMILKGFSAAKTDWQEKVKSETAVLLEKHPLPLPPAVQTPELGRDLTVQGKGAGKFCCVKIPLDLMPNRNCMLSFRIAKGVNTSTKATDTQVLIGQYDRDHKKFQLIRSFATRIPRDGQFHEVADNFRTPSEIIEPFIYVYNINSDDIVRVQNVKITRKD